MPVTRGVACDLAGAEHALADLRSQQLPGTAASATADLLLIDEAVLTAQIEGYRATSSTSVQPCVSEIA